MTNRRILVVDDNPDLHLDFKKILKSSENEEEKRLKNAALALFGEDKTSLAQKIEFELDFASQGEEAFGKVVAAHEAGRPYALLFVDVRMPPGWDGITTIAKIWEKVPCTEVVICTAYTDYSFEEVLSKLGVSERLLFLKKPFDSVEVLQIAIAQTKKWNLEQSNIKYSEGLEQEVELRTKELDQERARSVNGAKLMALGEMAGGIAHEINNPLTIIQQNAQLLSEMLEEKMDFTAIQKRTKKIIETTERIAKIIRGLRTFSRSGDNDPFDTVTMAQLIEQTLGMCREKFKVQDIMLTVDNPAPSTTVECRQVQIIQVLLNLLNNSYDAIEKNAERWVKIEVADFVDHVELALTDSGCGIPVAVQEKIFQPFFTTKEVGRGTGLGLSISRGIIESHQGQFWIDKQSKNTRFVISLNKKLAPMAEHKNVS